MIFAQRHRGGGSIDGIDGDRKHRNSVGLPSNIAQNTMGIFSPEVGLNFGSLGGSGQPSISDNLHSGLGSSDTRGLAAINGTSLHYDIQNYNQRSCELVAANMHAHHIKKEKIVLNLGVRTYLSTEDSAVGRLSKRHRVGSPSSQLLICQANDCKADLSLTKDYYRRHKVCEFHSKAPVVTVGGNSQRFCQQCSRFHCLGEFDNGKRSCRKRLADHNRRRRKIQSDAPTSGGTSTESITVNDVCNDEELHKNFSRLNDPKAWLSMYLENCGSPCFVSLKATNEKLGASCDKLQIQATDLNLCRSPRDDYRSSYSGISGLRHSQSGPNLSYSSRGQQGLQGRGGRRPMSGQSCNKTQPPVQWLKPINASSDNMTELACRQGTMKMQNLLPTDSKSGITSVSASSSISQEHDVEVFSPTNQNLLPMGSNDLSSLEWMPGSMREAQTAHSVFNPFGQSTIMSNLQGIAHHEAGDQIVALINTSNLADANPDNHGCSQNVLAKNAQMEHQQQKTPEADSGGGNNSRGGSSPVDSPDIKYSDLQLLRPDSYGSSAYDSHLNLF